MMEIVFKKAVRRAVPCLMGIVGPSGTGKTFSALRVASGMQRITGGRIKVVDTEHNRALQYADYFDFDHLPFDPPYSSLRYLEIIKAAAKTPGPLVIDSMSHEHEGEGGYIWAHDREVERLVSGGGYRNEYSASVPAWALPAKHRQQLINGIVTSGVSAIFCFRAKEKVDMDAKKPDGSTTVGKLGWMPIAGDAFVFEMQANCILLPGANGKPNWNPQWPGEKATCKLPIYLQKIFAGEPQLNETIGEGLARWSAGQKLMTKEDAERADELLSLYKVCSAAEDFKSLEARRAKLWSSIDQALQASLKTASDDAGKRTGAKAQPQSPPSTPSKEYIAGVDDPSLEVPR